MSSYAGYNPAFSYDTGSPRANADGGSQPQYSSPFDSQYNPSAMSTAAQPQQGYTSGLVWAYDQGESSLMAPNPSNYTYHSTTASRALSPFAASNLPSIEQQIYNNGQSSYDHLVARGTSAPQQPAQHQRSSSLDQLQLLLSPSLMDAETEPLVHHTAPGTQGVADQWVLDNFAIPASVSSMPELSHVSAPLLPDPREDFLDQVALKVEGLSMEPIPGREVLTRLKGCFGDVRTRFIPCVDFLVQCQQDLRKGLTMATKSRRGRQMTPRQFYLTFIENLPNKFYAKNQFSMDREALQEAVQGLKKLRADAKGVERQGCEAIKNQFLGGMKEGESWGLRKWLSKNGNALRMCTDLECIMRSIKALEKKEANTIQLCELLRPLAKASLDRLKSDIPPSYQERSAAHPYLPFFHRLEAALRGMATYDPTEDDVICLDDSDDDDDHTQEVKMPARAAAAPPPKKRRKLQTTMTEQKPRIKIDAKRYHAARMQQPVALVNLRQPNGADSSSGESDDESVIEVVGVLPVQPDTNVDTATDRQQGDILQACHQRTNHLDLLTKPQPAQFWPPFPQSQAEEAASLAYAMADALDELAVTFEEHRMASVRPVYVNPGSFWEADRYASALRLFGKILRMAEAAFFVEPLDDDQFVTSGLPEFSRLVRHPVCFREVVTSLIQDFEGTEDYSYSEGNLPSPGLNAWNMWKGYDLLQAVDLVFLNCLGYGKLVGEGRSKHRSDTNKLRKTLWKGIADIVGDGSKQYMPTRRSETSGFVVYKNSRRRR